MRLLAVGPLRDWWRRSGADELLVRALTVMALADLDQPVDRDLLVRFSEPASPGEP